MTISISTKNSSQIFSAFLSSCQATIVAGQFQMDITRARVAVANHACRDKDRSIHFAMQTARYGAFLWFAQWDNAVNQCAVEAELIACCQHVTVVTDGRTTVWQWRHNDKPVPFFPYLYIYLPGGQHKPLSAEANPERPMRIPGISRRL